MRDVVRQHEGMTDWRQHYADLIGKYADRLDALIASSPTTAATGAPAQELAEMEARKDAAYEERNRVVAALAHMALRCGYKAGIARTAIEGWSDDWHGCVYIEGPWGQASWHYHDSQAPLFASLPSYDGAWDGHTTEQKYERLASLSTGGSSSPEKHAPNCAREVMRHADDSAACNGKRT